jgi:predicted permease
LRPDVSRERAGAELAGIAHRLERLHPGTNRGHGAAMAPLARGVVDEFSPAFISVAMAAVGFVLLIVCANLAGLLLARSARRRKEMAIRSALGATRLRIVRQLLVESLLLALLGAALGWMVALWGVDLMKASIPSETTRYIPGWSRFELDSVALGFSLLLAVACALLFGLAPALHASRVEIHGFLKEGGRGSRAAAAPRVRRALAATQVALALVLVVGAALTVRGFQRLAKQTEAFGAARVLTMRITLPDEAYADPARRRTFYRQALAALRDLPGAREVSLGNRLPLVGGGGTVRIVLPESTTPEGDGSSAVDRPVVSPGYFRCFGVPVVAGREFRDGDDENAPAVAVVSESMARRYWPGRSALGRRVRLPDAGDGVEWITVVGVVADVKRSWLDREPRPTLYVPFLQAPRQTIRIALLASADPATLYPAARERIAAADASLPVYRVKTLEEDVHDQVSGVRLTAVLMGLFGGLAVLLASLGLYGVVAQSTAQRHHEFGVRVALGARPQDVERLVLSQGLKLAIPGVAFGLPAAWAISWLLARMLFGVVTVDSGLLAAAVAVQVAVVLLASYLPARGATRVDPIAALRSE